MLLPLPSDDDSLLGRVLPNAPVPGRALDELAQPNACEEKLAPRKASPTVALFEDAQDISRGAGASAVLGTFGFSADAKIATHFLYRIQTEKQITRLDTAEYLACCKEKGSCGFGFVSALVYGEGEYATGEETNASGGMNLVHVATAQGSIAIRKIHIRKVHGWFAAIVKPSDPSKSPALSSLGIAQQAGITEDTVSDTVKNIYASEKLSICAVPNGQTTSWAFCGKTGPITEREFARRYVRMTGSPELDDIDTSRTKGLTWAGVSLLALGAGGWTLAAMTWCADGQDCKAAAPIAGGVAGALGTLYGAIFLGLGLGLSEGGESNHLLTEYDGRLYVQRYNRTLLRRAIRDAQTGEKSTSSLVPIFAKTRDGGFLGVSFTF